MAVTYTPLALVYKFLLYPGLQLYRFVFRPEARGVRCLVEWEGKLLLVRNTYGDMKWVAPGGGIARGEAEAEAAVREVLEETGVRVTGVRPLGQYTGSAAYAKDTVICFYGRAEAGALTIDRKEIYDAGWFEPDALPAPLSQDTERIIGMYRRPAG